ncbi:MAG: formylmethanofuran dehydrogenase subunit B [Halobacteriota archaeon]|nr:formylmethanofuran dehydrogenase subunit B [Halobacteriota archaeon]
MQTCNGCSCLCDDIEAVVEEKEIKEVRNACRIGADLFLDYNINRASCAVAGEAVEMDKAMESAIDILRNAKKPFIYGLDSSTIESQRLGVKLAKKIGAVIDSSSSYRQGTVMEKILSKEIKTCTLDDVRNNADLILYWGSDPSNSHPRHMSRYTYFPRGERRLKGWETERKTITIDVRKSSTAIVGKNNFIIPPGRDADFISEIMIALDGKVPSTSVGVEEKKIIGLADRLKNAEYGIIFTGMALLSSLNGNINVMKDLLIKLNEFTEFYLMPMLHPVGARGLDKILFDETGYTGKVKFDSEGGTVEHKDTYSFVESLKNEDMDAALIVGSDPLSTIPYSLSKRLKDIPTIAIDSKKTPTTEISNVVLPCAKVGIESAGSMLRMDGVGFSIDKIIESEWKSEEEILNSLTEMI